MTNRKLPEADPQTWLAGVGFEIPAARPVAPPIYQTSTFWASDADEFLQMATAARHPGFYTRYGNPTVRLLEDAVARLEGGEAAIAMASGMAATVAAILTFAGAGKHVIAQHALYGGTMGFLRNIASRLGIGLDLFDPQDFASFAAALKPETRLIVLESPTNPLLKLTDVAALSAHAHSVSNAMILIDNTLATPINQQPLALGADLVMHSVTKSMGGHSDVSGGILVGSIAHVTAVWQTAYLLGATLDPFAAWLALRGLRTLPLRVAQHNSSALKVAGRLEGHRKVKTVNYPGLKSHPQFELARRQMRGAGGVLSFEVEGGMHGAEVVMAKMQLAHRSASFGSFSTLAAHPAAMWAGMMNEAQLQQAGLPAGLVRIGVGLEDPDRICEDIEVALDHV